MDSLIDVVLPLAAKSAENSRYHNLNFSADSSGKHKSLSKDEFYAPNTKVVAS